MTHYDTLGVEEGATSEELLAAYRCAVKAAHPDRGGDPRSFHAVQEAWATLGDPTRRSAYDAELAAHAAKASAATGSTWSATNHSDPWFVADSAPPPATDRWWSGVSVYSPTQLGVTLLCGFVAGCMIAVARSAALTVKGPLPPLAELPGRDLTFTGTLITGVLIAALAPFVREWVTRSPRRAISVAAWVAAAVWIHVLVALVAIGWFLSLVGRIVTRRRHQWRSRHW